MLDRIEPVRVWHAHPPQQPVARAQRVRSSAFTRRGMAAVDRFHQAVEEPCGARMQRPGTARPSSASAKPSRRMIAEGRCGRDRLAVDAAAAGRRGRCVRRAGGSMPVPSVASLERRLRLRRRLLTSRHPGCRRRHPAWRGAACGRARETRSPRCSLVLPAPFGPASTTRFRHALSTVSPHGSCGNLPRLRR